MHVKPKQLVIVICNCNCKYDKLYSTAGGKPWHFKDASQERSLSALYRMLVITDQVQFQLFLKAGRVLVSRIVAGRLFQVRGPATSKARSPILVLVLGTKTSDDFDDRSRDLLQSSDSGLILSAK